MRNGYTCSYEQQFSYGKAEQDNQTIGILICKDKDDVVAEYALDDVSQPIGIARYELTKVLRDEFKSSLPTIEEDSRQGAVPESGQCHLCREGHHTAFMTHRNWRRSGFSFRRR